MSKHPGIVRQSSPFSCEDGSASPGSSAAASPARESVRSSRFLPSTPVDMAASAADGTITDSPPSLPPLFIPPSLSSDPAMASDSSRSDSNSKGDQEISAAGAGADNTPLNRVLPPSLRTSFSLSCPVRPPANRREAVPIIAGALRFGWSEILARWNLHDLTLGVYYLSRREGNAWDLYGEGSRSKSEDKELDDGDKGEESHEPAKEIDVSEESEIKLIARLLRTLELLLCTTRASKLPLRKGLDLLESICQARLLWADAKSLKASLLRPAFAVLRCDELKSIVVTIRGTRSFKDTLTGLVGGTVPFHYSPGGGSESPVLGYTHNGMMVAAKEITKEIGPFLADEVASAPQGYRVIIVGHSLGAGTAVLMTIFLRFQYPGIPALAQCTCVAFAPPSCLTKELAKSCEPFVTSVLNGCDFVPTVCRTSVSRLRRWVRKSSWGEKMRKHIAESSQSFGRNLLRASSSAATNIIRKSFRREKAREVEAGDSLMVTSHSISSAASEYIGTVDEDADAASPPQEVKVTETKVSAVTNNPDRKDLEDSSWSGTWMFDALQKSLTEVRSSSGRTVSSVSTFFRMYLGMQSTDSNAEAQRRHSSQQEQITSEYIDTQNRPLDVVTESFEPKSTRIMEDTEAELNESIIADQEHEMLEAAAEAAEHSNTDNMFVDDSSGVIENEEEDDSKGLETTNEDDLIEDTGSGIIRRTSSGIDEDQIEFFIPGSIIHFLKKPSGSDRKSVAIRTRQEQYCDIYLCRQMILDHQLPCYQKSITEVLQYDPE